MLEIFNAKIITEEDNETLIECEIVLRTNKAVQIVGVENKLVFLPLSEIEIVEDKTTFDGNRSKIMVPNWLILKEPIV